MITTLKFIAENILCHESLIIHHTNQPLKPSAAGGHRCARLVRRGILRSRSRGVSRDSPAAFERRHGGSLRRFLPWKTSLTSPRVTSKRLYIQLLLVIVGYLRFKYYTYSCIRRYKLMLSFLLNGEKEGGLQAADPLLPRAPSSRACLRSKLDSPTAWESSRTDDLMWYPPSADGLRAFWLK